MRLACGWHILAERQRNSERKATAPANESAPGKHPGNPRSESSSGSGELLEGTSPLSRSVAGALGL
jgi:hypothetical protein